MPKRKKIAISVGDLNGIGIEIILRAHTEIVKLCDPIYCIHENLLKQASKLLNLAAPKDFTMSQLQGDFKIQPGVIDKASGRYSFDSFVEAIQLAENKEVKAIVTLPIHKEAWSLAGLTYKGHTDYLRAHFQREAIMMLGCEDLFVALYTEHIPLAEVATSLELEKLKRFLVNFYEATHFDHVALLGLNPHAGDGGVLGDEENIISQAINEVNLQLKQEVFHGPLVPDVAFTPRALQSCNRIIAMYHDQGLAPLKALYFDQSINVSLHLPIVRTSVDHGTAFDIAYKGKHVQFESYINAVKAATVDF